MGEDLNFVSARHHSFLMEENLTFSLNRREPHIQTICKTVYLNISNCKISFNIGLSELAG